ncbi:MAG TPA: peptide chain release factor N(5)-glutamine methyltransferase [Actinomycetes bacterium]|nr:peptide chain release factor N(5)-glutamine methyltransferase [Actinomycetes bacterium]
MTTANGEVDLAVLLRRTTERLAAAGVPSPRFDATALAAYVLGIEPAEVALCGSCGPDQAAAVEELAARREARIPLQHLTGRAYFRHVSVAVGPGVFVPRPETEVVAGAVIDEVRRLVGLGVQCPVVVDLCTGSGVIALSVVDEAPQARVHAVEVSADAYAWALRNLAGTGVDLRLGDAFVAFPDLEGRVDVVVSNPPYIPPDGIIRDPEVADHDPPIALWGGGGDGLEVPRRVAARAAVLLRESGLLVMEHADVQREAALAMLSGWDDVHDHRDLAGRDRFVTARRGRMTR